MPKVNANNRITRSLGSLGRIEQHELYLNQGVNNYSSPTFNNLHLTGNGYIEGSLTVDGDFTILSTEILELADNIILINREETGPGVTLNRAGIEVERGSSTNYQFVYQESDGTFRSGLVGSLQAISHRQDAPLDKGISIWNDIAKRWDSKTEVNLDIFFNSLTNSTNSATGNVIISGGVGIGKDVHIDGKVYLTGTFPNTSVVYTDSTTNDIQIQSVNIDLVPMGSVTIPANKPLVFHSASQYVMSNTGGNLTIGASDNINITPASGKSVIVPNQIPIVFSTAAEKIYTDSANDMNIDGSQNINLTPAIGKRIRIPVDIPLTFSNNNQTIQADSFNNITIQAGNDVKLVPGSLRNVTIPTDAGVLFGAVGTQRIFANSSSELTIVSTSDIYLTPSSGDINIPSNIGLVFGSDTQKIEADTSGNLSIEAATNIRLLSTTSIGSTVNATSATVGSLHTNGGIGAAKTVLSEEAIVVNSTNAEAIRATVGARDTFVVSNANSGSVSINTGDGTISNSGLNITNDSGINAKSHIQLFGGTFDTRNGYSIGHGSNSINLGRAMTFNIPEASEYGDTIEPKFIWMSNDLSKELFSIEANTGNITALGGLSLTGTENAINATTASMVVLGGLGVVKDIYTDGSITIDETDSSALLVRKEDNGGDVFTVDTSADVVTVNAEVLVDHTSANAMMIRKNVGGKTIFKVDTSSDALELNGITRILDTTESVSVSSGSVVASGGVGIVKKLFVGGETKMLSNLDMSLQYITNVATPQNDKDVATKEYVDLALELVASMFVKDSVRVATTTAGTLATSFEAGQVIDTYTLVTLDRILIKDQANAVENGIYEVQATGAPIRAIDYKAGDEASGTFAFVQEGAVNKNLGWICNTPTAADIIGTDPLNFTQFTGLGQVVAGNGISKTFNTIDVNVDGFSLEINSDALRIRDCTIGTGLTGGSGQIIQTTSDQSHVTQLGTITSGAWNASTISVLYGGTGQTQFTAGSLIMGNSASQLGSDSQLYFNTTTKFLSLGAGNSPSYKLHIKDTSNAVVRIDADSTGTVTTASPELSLTFDSSNSRGLLAMARTDNQYANGTAVGSLILAHNNTDSSSKIHLATNQQTRVTIEQSGNVGIGILDPEYLLDIGGTLNTTGLVSLRDSTNATNGTSASVVMYGGLSAAKDTYIGGSVYLTGEFAAPMIEIGSKTGAQTVSIDFNTSGSGNDYDSRISCSGGNGSIGKGSMFIDSELLYIRNNTTTISSTTVSSATTNGALVVVGGIGTSNNANIGGSINVLSNTANYIGPYELVRRGSENFLTTGDATRTNGSFTPLNIGEYGSTGGGIAWTFHSSGVVLLNSGTLQIGGTFGSQDGYKISFSALNSELNIVPVANGDTIVVGDTTSGELSDLRINGTSNGSVLWSSGTSKLIVEDSTTVYRKNGNVKNIQFSTPDVSTDTARYSAQSADMTLNFGENGTGQLTVELSNTDNSSSLTFTPSATHSNLVLTSNVYSTFNGPVTFNDTVTLPGSAQILTISNTSSSVSQWYYLGRINTTSGSNGAGEKGYTDLTMYNGVDYNTAPNTPSGLHFIGTTRGGSFTGQHKHIGLGYNTSALLKSTVVVYNDASDNYHLFVRATTDSEQNIIVGLQNHTTLTLTQEGTGSVPNGSLSGYSGGWTLEFTSDTVSNLVEFTGNLTVEKSIDLADNLPVIGLNNTNTTASRDVGILFQRYQKPNDAGTGDTVNDVPSVIDILPDQTSALITQVILSGSASGTDDFYNGWWIKVTSGTNTNQTRRIIDYNGSLKVATLETVWTTQKPASGDVVHLFDTNYTTMYYKESTDRFVFGYTVNDPGFGNNVVVSRTAGAEMDTLTITNTVASTSSSIGSILSSGGLSISNTNNASSSTSGGTITTLGGAGISKNIYVGGGVHIGSDAGLTGNLSIRKSNVEMTLKNDSAGSNYSFIDFVSDGSSNRAGILYKNSQLVLTSNTSGTSPNVAGSIPGMVIDTASGYVGIGTTQNINSQMTIVSGGFVGVNTLDGADNSFLGLVGGGGNTSADTRAARIELSGNERSGNNGVLLLAAGNTGTNGGIKLETGGISRLEINYSGDVTITNTTVSTSSTLGALKINGGIAISATANSSSFTSGGALTVGGGGAIGGDLYVNGDIIATGSLSGGGSVITPTLVFSNTTNCVVNSYDNQRVIKNGSEASFSIFIQATPLAGSSNTSFEFVVPERTTNWASISEFTGNVQGFTNSGDPIALSNTVIYAITGTTRVQVKFQSVDATAHYIYLMCRYMDS